VSVFSFKHLPVKIYVTPSGLDQLFSIPFVQLFVHGHYSEFSRSMCLTLVYPYTMDHMLCT